VALAAARSLDGTPAGVAAALKAASDTAKLYSYGYGANPVTWSDEAISFGASPDRSGTWVSAGTAPAMAASMLCAKVDTKALSAGSVQMSLIRVVLPSLDTVEMNADAIAGRSILDVTPLALCAMGPASGQRTN